MSKRLATLLVGAMVLGPGSALAHPHILATARLQVVLAPDGNAIGIRESWTYDPAYSAYALKSADDDRDGKVSDAELERLAQKQLEALQQYNYFTTATRGGTILPLEPATASTIKRLTTGAIQLSFTVPFKTAAAMEHPLTIELFDPNFFAYFTMSSEAPPTDAAPLPESCTSDVVGPQSINLKQTASVPSAFWAALDGSSEAGRQFVNRITVTCHSTATPSRP